MKDLIFYLCEKCGNVGVKVVDKGPKLMCCGTPMVVLEPNTVDAAGEKHAPVAALDGDILDVNVGEIDHPMTEEHSILWVCVELEDGVLTASLTPEDAPHAQFALNGKKPVAVYSYCNLHGLWKTEL